MKKTLTRCAALAVLLWSCTSAYAQQLKFNLGDADQFVAGLQKQEAVQKQNGLSITSRLSLDVNPSTHFEAIVNYSSSSNGNYAIRGQVAGIKGSTVFLDYEKGALSGSIILEGNVYNYSSDAAGNAYVTPVDIDDVVCVEYDKDKAAHSAHSSSRENAVAAVGDAYKLQSLPGSPNVIYLDYNGHYLPAGSRWNSGNPITAAASGFSEAQVTESWELAAEDFRPFNLNVTTDEAVFNAAAPGKRMRVIITPTNTAAPGSGGVAYIGSFNFTREDPCWVFNLGTKSAGETISHEVGHTLYLGHDGRTTPSEGYYGGHGTWGPIMGAPFSKPVVQWSKGEYANSNNKEDDLNIITTRTGFTYRADAVGNTTGTATPLTVSSSGAITVVNGLIERNTDLDFFSFSTSGGTITINASPAPRHGDLDIKITLYNSAGSVVGTADGTGLAATLSAGLSAGTYYISIDGVGYLDPATTGYSDYASLGTYSLSGTIPNSTVNPPPTVSITAPANNSTFTAPATINITATAADANGTVTKVDFYNGSTLLFSDNSAPYSYSWTGVPAGSYTITARATDNQGAVTTSAPVNVVVNGVVTNQAPIVSITAPANNSVYTAPATINISANASDPDGTVTKVDFYNGSTLLFSDNTAPYSYSWTPVSAGAYNLTARATDNDGAVTTSAIVSIVVNTVVTNQPPTITLTGPTTTSYVAPATIVITATAADSDGTVTKVDFYNGSTLLFSDNTAPYSYSWPNVAAGTYTLSARATDNSGAVTTSSTRTVTVTNPTNGCSGIAVYVENNGYVPGSKVQAGGKIYQCKPWPYSGWCNGVAWAYGPGTGSAWADAWTLIGNCSARVSAAQSAGIVSPNPTSGMVTIKVDNASTVLVVNTYGEVVIPATQIDAEGTLDLSALPTGIYMLKIDNGTEVITEKLVKN